MFESAIMRATSNEQRATSNEPSSYPLISVIVPVYKVEKYLDKCITSIVNQTYSNLEIILVDDGSPDNCPAMCDDWARKDSRIKVIHKPNGELSSARNAGLDASTGELIGHIDSDDYIAPNMYEKLYSLLLDTGADMAICEFTVVDEEGSALNVQGKAMNDEVMTREQMFMKYNSNIHYSYAWNKLYRAEIFADLRFRGSTHDDTGTIHRIIGECEKIVVTSEPLYFYLKRADSGTSKMNAPSFLYSHFKGGIEAYRDRYEYFMSIGRPDLADSGITGTIVMLKYALRYYNYFQFSDDLKKIMHDVVSKTIHADTFMKKKRIIKLAIVWLRSLFRPFIGKEKLSLPHNIVTPDNKSPQLAG